MKGARTQPAADPTAVTLSWAADAPARTKYPDTLQPTRDELTKGQIAAEHGLDNIERGLENLASLCRTLGSNLDTPAVDFAIALRVVADHMDNIRFDLSEQAEAIVPLANLAAWYHRSASAQKVSAP